MNRTSASGSETSSLNTSVAFRGKNNRFPLTDRFRQAVYRRLAGYENVNDAERLSPDPAFRLVGTAKTWDRGAIGVPHPPAARGAA